MLRPTFIRLAARTIVRDPRIKKTSIPSTALSNHVIETQDNNKLPQLTSPGHNSQVGTPLGIDHHHHQSTGAMLGSYVLAGVGVALGVGLVRLVLGV